MNIVYVRWIDSHGMTGSWQKRDEYERWFAQPDDGVQETVGFLAREDDTWVMVIQSRSRCEPDEVWDNAIKIPKLAIRERRDLGNSGATEG